MTSANLGGGGELIGDYENRESETIQQTAFKNILIMRKEKKIKLNWTQISFALIKGESGLSGFSQKK